jgi:hypothetical protein
MSPQVRLPRCGELGLVALVIAGAGGCAPPCWDDGLLQGGCPGAATESNGGTDTSGSASATGTSTGTETSASGGAEEGMMTADAESGGSDGPVLCPGLDEQFTFATRTLQLVVEQSDAMQTMFDGATRWSAVEDALVDPGNGAVTLHQSTTRFGLTAYHGLQAGCPLLASVPPQLDAVDEISAVFTAEAPGGANPVGDTIDTVVDDLTADAWVGDKAIVLFTGDEPTTCMLPNPANALELTITRDAAETAVAAAFDAGFPTFVVSIDEDIDAGFLQVLANAGAGHQAGDPDATFFVVHDDQELATALEEILALDRPCSFTLGQALPMEVAPGCTVEVNGAPVSYDDPNGWSRPDEQTVELQGSACEAIQQGDASVEMVCNCDDV